MTKNTKDKLFEREFRKQEIIGNIVALFLWTLLMFSTWGVFLMYNNEILSKQESWLIVIVGITIVFIFGKNYGIDHAEILNTARNRTYKKVYGKERRVQ